MLGTFAANETAPPGVGTSLPTVSGPPLSHAAHLAACRKLLSPILAALCNAAKTMAITSLSQLMLTASLAAC